MDIYSLKNINLKIDTSSFVESSKGKRKIILIDKHHYLIHLIISPIIRGDKKGAFFTNLNSDELKQILGRDYKKIIENLKDLNLIEENKSYRPGNYSKSYRIVPEILKSNEFCLYEISPTNFKVKIQSGLRNQIKDSENSYVLHKLLINTLKLKILDEPHRFRPDMDFVKTEVYRINSLAPTIHFGNYVDNPHRKFRYQEFRKALINLNNYNDELSLIQERVYYKPSIAASGRIYHMATSIPRKIRKGLRTKKNEVIYEVDMASAQPSLLMLEWLNQIDKKSMTDSLKQEFHQCKELIIKGGIYDHIKKNSTFYNELEYAKLKKNVLTAINSEKTTNKPSNELKKVFPSFIHWINSLKKEKGYKYVSHLGQSKEADLFVEVFKSLPDEVFAIIIHDCILTTKNETEEVKKRLSNRTKVMYPNIFKKNEVIESLFKVNRVSFKDDELSDSNYFEYVAQDSRWKQLYYESLEYENLE